MNPTRRNILLAPPPRFAAKFDGASYLQKTSPVNMDLNGSEILLNPTFDASLDDWSLFGNTTITLEGTIKRTGTNSCKVTLNANGNLGIQSGLKTNATTNKYTNEGWVYIPAATSSKVVRIGLLNQLGSIIVETEYTVTADTWTKIVKNQQLPGTQTGIRYVVRLMNGLINDIFYVDDASLTQAFDYLYCGFVLSDSLVLNGGLLYLYSSTKGYNISISNQNTPIVQFRENNTTIGISVDANFLPSAKIIHCVAVTFERVSNTVKTYRNGSEFSSTVLSTPIGKTQANSPLRVGWDEWNVACGYWVGKRAKAQFVKFAKLPSNIAEIIAYISARREHFNAYLNGEIAAWHDFRDGSLRDKSGNGNHLSVGAGSVPIVRI